MRIEQIITILLFSLAIVSCSNDDTNPNDNSMEIKEIKTIAQSSSWKITSFIDSGVDETNHFTGYTFTFNSDGTLEATNGINTYMGTWSVTNGSSNDNSSDDIDFNIFFSSPANFKDDLSEDWDIVSKSSTKIELMHISGGNGGTDTLTFEKIS
ncbi:META domain-containing protein [Aestuariivivens sp. NBU2969]|uniref:beta-barrel fold lipoprotein n=1 Tax=Aestuariivivens sp. NBU2969 TaxID=2873267 RepID=UPI001CBDA651|nr:META domain-containing protein [Aestuariivivens sp. NBU2969]